MLLPRRRIVPRYGSSGTVTPKEGIPGQMYGVAGTLASQATGALWKDRDAGNGITYKSQGEAGVTGALQGAGTGAALGSMIPIPGGAAIGAGVGALVGGIGGLIGNAKAKREAMAQSNEITQNNIEQQRLASAEMYNNLGQKNVQYAAKGSKIFPKAKGDCGCGCHGKGTCGGAPKYKPGGAIVKPKSTHAAESTGVARRPLDFKQGVAMDAIRDPETRRFLEQNVGYKSDSTYYPETYNREVVRLHQQMGNPIIRTAPNLITKVAGRSNYNALTNTMNLEAATGKNIDSRDMMWNQSQYKAELAHALQRQQMGTPAMIASGVKSWLRDPYITPKGQGRQYDLPGSLEYNAHTELEPGIEKLFSDNRIGGKASAAVFNDRIALTPRTKLKTPKYKPGGELPTAPTPKTYWTDLETKMKMDFEYSEARRSGKKVFTSSVTGKPLRVVENYQQKPAATPVPKTGVLPAPKPTAPTPTAPAPRVAPTPKPAPVTPIPRTRASVFAELEAAEKALKAEKAKVEDYYKRAPAVLKRRTQARGGQGEQVFHIEQRKHLTDYGQMTDNLTCILNGTCSMQEISKYAMPKKFEDNKQFIAQHKELGYREVAGEKAIKALRVGSPIIQFTPAGGGQQYNHFMLRDDPKRDLPGNEIAVAQDHGNKDEFGMQADYNAPDVPFSPSGAFPNETRLRGFEFVGKTPEMQARYNKLVKLFENTHDPEIKKLAMREIQMLPAIQRDPVQLPEIKMQQPQFVGPPAPPPTPVATRKKGGVIPRPKSNPVAESTSAKTRPLPTRQMEENAAIQNYLSHTGTISQAPSDLVRNTRTALRYANNAASVAQTGNFIPHPVAQIVGKVGSAVGAGTNLISAGMDYYNGDYGSMAGNLGSAALGSAVGVFGRGISNSKYLMNGFPRTMYINAAKNPHLGAALVGETIYNQLGTRKPKYEAGGAVILGGNRHAEGGKLGKGNPIVDAQTGEKVAETETQELLLSLEQTQKAQTFIDAYNEDQNDKHMLELGKYIQHVVLNETVDNSQTYDI